MATKEKKVGRPCQYEIKVKPYLKDIERYVSCGVTEHQICMYYNVGKTQWNVYKKKYTELSELLYRSKEICHMTLINRAFEVATGYEYTEEVITETDKGTFKKTYKKYAKADAGMIMFLLINRYPSDYARDPQILELRKQLLELQTKGNKPADMGSV